MQRLSSTALHPQDLPARLSPVDIAALDRFSVPDATSSVREARPRSCVVLDVEVQRVGVCRWVGGPVLEAVAADSSGLVTLAFLGRRAIAGLEPGRRLAAAGTILRLVDAHTTTRALGFLGEDAVNVLELNLALDRGQ